MCKAYDCVEWAYLGSMMRKMGFEEKWVSLIMMCVTTASFSVLINGEPRGTITPSRGLRQGNPISPYLFLLCAEGLTALIRKKEAEGMTRGVPVSRLAPSISYLFFAEDCIIFCRATMEECRQVTSVLEVYEKESGQKLNREKTSLFFSKNINEDIQNFVKNTFEAQIVKQHEKYLGLPPMVGRGKKKAFSCIKDQVGRKIAGWKGRLLSNASREILIKAVAQATPTYTMNCFKLPDSLCSEINSMVGGFWWGQKDKERKIAWVLWQNLCKPKAEGALGFRELRAFNLALLAKQGWRIQQSPNSLTHRVLKTKYFADSSFMDAKVGKNPSYIWRSKVAAIPVIKEGAKWVVGDGRSIKIWGEKWIPSTESGRIITLSTSMESGAKVVSLIVQERVEWDAALIRCTFLPHEAEAILSIPISPMKPLDSQVWAKSNGIFTVKSAHRVAAKYLADLKGRVESPGCSENSKMTVFWKVLWNLKCPNKIKHFMWRACRNVLPTKQCLLH
ncbi:hypothetical protein SO802_011468 [Lithocarpus litseifolius]|uniref:Reverse transcriptase domain-containing protein n=1 Tax=Lithocarpus litseifolius TaxID=425828 RepID=A0AAW2D034_9ROSI